MNTNKEIKDLSLEESMEFLSRKLYSDSPDLYIDFTDRKLSNVYDEMVLFFACKHNCLSIVSHAIENNIIDLSKASRNTSYKDIFSLLLDTSKRSNSNDIYNYLLSLGTTPISNDDSLDNDNTENKPTNANKEDTYIPQFKCSACNSNVIQNGFRTTKDITYKLSSDHKSLFEIDSRLSDYITCNTCNTKINNTTLNKLESLLNISNCSNCSINMYESGITSSCSMEFDTNSNEFVSGSNIYKCSKCNYNLNKNQLKHFNL